MKDSSNISNLEYPYCLQ
jgi:NADPH:quinone reductase-like Zn-dependent oxidoreductase